MGKGSTKTTTQQTTLDPQTQAYLDAYRKQAATLSGTGPNAQTLSASDLFSRFTGNLGFGMQTGLSGVDAYFNPYQQDVIGGIQSDFARQRVLAGNQANDMATQAGAFGDSRSAILQAQLLRDINQNETGTVANFRNLGFTNAVQQMLQERARALESAQFGATGTAGIGQYLDARQIAMLQPWLQSMGLGGSTTTTTEKVPGNFLKDLAGVGLLAAAPFTGGATLAPGAAMFGMDTGGFNPWASAPPQPGRSPYAPGYDPRLWGSNLNLGFGGFMP